MPIRVTINQSALRELLSGPNGDVVKFVRDLTRRVENEAKRRVAVDEGTLRASISSTVTVEPGRVVGRVGSPLPYARYVEEGTGLYGPKHRLITPVSAKVLRFKGTRGGGAGDRPGGWVFTPYVRGMRPRPYLVPAVRAVVPWPITYIR